MDTNMSGLDRMIRGFLVGPVALALAWIVGFASWGGIALTAVAAIMVVTALVGFCPLYALLRVRTKTARG